MFGKLLFCLLFSLYGNWTDWKSYKIPNWTVLCTLIVGLIWNFARTGLKGLFTALVGMLIPLILFPLFAVRMLGAGDVKALCAMGCLMGGINSFRLLIASILCSGGFAVMVLCLRKNGRARARYLIQYLKCCYLSHQLMPYIEENVASNDGVFRFSFGITGGVICLFIMQII